MKKKIVPIVLIVVIMVGILGVYIYDVIINDTLITDGLFRLLAIEFAMLATIVRVFNAGDTKLSLSVYEKTYSKEIGDAFEGTTQRKKLLCAVRLFHEEKYNKSLKYLSELRKASNNDNDIRAVHMFAALCFDRMGIDDLAVQEYREFIKIDPNNHNAYSNLGIVYERYGDYKNAKLNYLKSIEIKPDNQFAYNNIAQCYFKERDFETAISYAEKALEFDNNLNPTLKLLAIIYHIMNDNENRDKYFHRAISNGENPNELKEALDYFKVEFKNEDSEEFINQE